MIFLGDCLTRMRELDENSVDSIVTDPPYGLKFMGKKWDYKGGIVLDPFMGSGSTGVAAFKNNFQFIGIEMNEEYVEIARRRIDNEQTRGA